MFGRNYMSLSKKQTVILSVTRSLCSSMANTNLQDDLDMKYLWGFILFSLYMVMVNSKKSNLPLPSVGHISYDLVGGMSS